MREKSVTVIPKITEHHLINLERLHEFIELEKQHLAQAAPDINWSHECWSTKNWLLNRSKDQTLLFRELSDAASARRKSTPLPADFADFCKAIVVHFQRTRGLSHMGVRVYLFDLRRIFNSFFKQGYVSPLPFLRWHFEETAQAMKEQNYSGIYDSCTRLQAISELIDKKQLTKSPIGFQHGMTPNSKYLRYVPLIDPGRDEKIRKDAGKLPSREALEAYAECTNNPLNDDEEILLRTIDLLIVMGQRGNEISCLPLDCWVERPLKDSIGNLILDANGRPILEIGIRYYPEKNFETRIHWLADQDISLARRAITRLETLTTGPRTVAKWQEDNPGRLWDIAPDEWLNETRLLRLLGYASKRNLYLYLSKNKGIMPREVRAQSIDRYYRAGDIERLLAPQIDHTVLKKRVNGKWHVILRTSETLSIRFDGAFRFIREANVTRVLPRRTTLKEINTGLGSNPKQESIFERRNLTEKNGERIALTSHQPRHWRNTLYELAGMSNVQQALAMGRRRLDENVVYQHTTLQERTENHDEFLKFSNAQEKMSFVHEAIRNRRILGGVTDTYHRIKSEQDIVAAERFLSMHAQAMHVTPYGACSHDFSQTPCPKHLQCWNNCSYLHRTNSPTEVQAIKLQLHQSELALKKMKEEADGEFGADVWIDDLEKKIGGMKKSLTMTVIDLPVPVFQASESMNHASVGGRSSVPEA